MLKLIKYEFRKNRTGLIVMLLLAAGLFLLAPLGRALHKEGMMVLSTVLLIFYAFAAYAYVLVRGIAAYSGELRSRSGYLLLMVPRSTMSILFSKLLFTLLFALVMLAVSLAALMGAGTIMTAEMYQFRSILETLRFAMIQVGLDPNALGSTLLFFVAEVLSSVLTVAAIGYLSATLSATVLQNGRLRGLVDVLIFCVLFALVIALTDLISPEVNALYADYAAALRAASPTILLQLVLIGIFTALSAVLLKRKVAL